MFEDERQRVSHRRGAIARGVAKRGLVAFLAFAMAFGTTPAQLWAEGAEGIAEAVAQAATPGEDAALAGGTAEQSGAEVSDSEGTPAFVHGGPFANIAHGCNSIMATRMAMRFGDVADRKSTRLNSSH